MFSNTKVLINSIKNYKTCSQRPLEKLKNKKKWPYPKFHMSDLCFFHRIFYRFLACSTDKRGNSFCHFCLCWCHFLYCFIIYLSVRIECINWHFFPVAHLLLFTILVFSYWSLCVCIADTCIVPSHSRCWMRRINFIRALFLRMAPQMSNTIFHQLNGKGAEWTM